MPSTTPQEPLCFNDMREKLEAGLYAVYEEFFSDINIICCNAVLYNPVLILSLSLSLSSSL